MLTSLSQIGPLEEFCSQFDACLLKVTILEPYAVSIFLKAVNPKIGGPVKMFQPETLREAFYLVKIQDATNKSAGISSMSKNTITTSAVVNKYSSARKSTKKSPHPVTE
ncbi:hypothetical protein E3N88_18775 [Mikania micrantha]|uniref:Uncharacterized protein n=1 Tax=Mikania micrantha TaxID=192012 RepID=A0A5N6NMS6_9ASTR|nr:hypothetical protein E3N88_18775 [Mikania micrantha]